MRKPNYNFERAERERAKAAKAAAKAERKRAVAAAAARGETLPDEPEDGAADDAGTGTDTGRA